MKINMLDRYGKAKYRQKYRQLLALLSGRHWMGPMQYPR
jgi:hypothetical protein